jgi:hypothetical protein
MTHPPTRWLVAATLVLAPVIGLVAAGTMPGVQATVDAELRAIAAHPTQFHIYALGILVSAYLTAPAVLGLTALIGRTSPGWALVAGGLTQLGVLVAIGDSATESMYAAMGAHPRERATMVALSDRYDAATGWIYTIGGLAVLLGSVLLGIALWRTRSLPRWAAVGVPGSVILNILGFSIASQPILVVSYLVMLAAFARAALEIATPQRTDSEHLATRGAAGEFVA